MWTKVKDGDLIMTKSWRPEGWEQPYKFTITPSLERLAQAEQTDEVRFLENESYEAGADAMLEALQEKESQIFDILIDLSEKDINRDMAYDRILMLWGSGSE